MLRWQVMLLHDKIRQGQGKGMALPSISLLMVTVTIQCTWKLHTHTPTYKSITFALRQTHRTICVLTQATFPHKPHPWRTPLPAQRLHAWAADRTRCGGCRAWSLHGWKHKLTERNVKAHSIALWHRSLIPILFAPFYSINNLENITQVVSHLKRNMYSYWTSK